MAWVGRGEALWPAYLELKGEGWKAADLKW